MRGFFLPLSILLFLFLSLLLPSVHCAWFVREVYSNTGCNTLSNVLVQELDTCYSDGVESNKYELNSAGNVLDKDCSDDECSMSFHSFSCIFFFYIYFFTFIFIFD